MSGNTPNVSRTIFDEDKRYFGRRYEQGKELFDWDVNEDWDELLWWQSTLFRELVGGDSGGFSDGSITAFHMTPALSPTNNVAFYDGFVIIKGRPVFTDTLSGSTFDYEDDTKNYILKGSVGSVTENTPALDYDVVDLEKKFVSNHGLGGSSIGSPARVKFTSGALLGQTFDVNSSATTSFNVLADLSLLSPGDTYTLLPPSLTTPLAGTQIDKMDVVVWLEDISELEDGDLEDPVLSVTPSQRREMRWMIYANWSGIDSTDITTGFLATTAGTITRGIGDSNVDAGDISNLLEEIVYLSGIEDNTHLVNSIDFIPTKFSGTTPTFPVGGSTFDVGQVNYVTSFLSNATSNKWIVDIAGSSGTIVDTSANKTYGLNINAAGTTATATEFLTLDIEENELALISTRVDASSNIVRNMRMGETMMHRGFNWQVDNITDLTIMPGERYCWGTLLQLNRPLTIKTTVSVINTPIPPGWMYIYLTRKSSAVSYRSLEGFFDATAPNWDGSHPDPASIASSAVVSTDGRAFCVGVVYVKNAIIELQEAYCVNNTIYFKESSSDHRGLLLNTSPVVNQVSTTVQTDVDLPKGMSDVGIELEYTDISIAAAFASVEIESKQGLTSTWKQEYQLPLIGSNEKAVLSFQYPANVGDSLHSTQLTASTITTQLGLRWAKFNPLYMYDNINWSQD